MIYCCYTLIHTLYSRTLYYTSTELYAGIFRGWGNCIEKSVFPATPLSSTMILLVSSFHRTVIVVGYSCWQFFAMTMWYDDTTNRCFHLRIRRLSEQWQYYDCSHPCSRTLSTRCTAQWQRCLIWGLLFLSTRNLQLAAIHYPGVYSQSWF